MSWQAAVQRPDLVHEASVYRDVLRAVMLRDYTRPHPVPPPVSVEATPSGVSLRWGALGTLLMSLGYDGELDRPGVAYVAIVEVRPAYRRQGIASGLMRTACRLCDLRGTALWLDVAPSMEVDTPGESALIEFYGRHGFEMYDRRHLRMVRNVETPE